ncbi:MAG: hypothetical protein ACFFG0_54495 [Candidatus Thorarchaeota archaeon]
MGKILKEGKYDPSKNDVLKGLEKSHFKLKTDKNLLEQTDKLIEKAQNKINELLGRVKSLEEPERIAW